MDYETRFYFIALFDYYQKLLTKKQQNYFKLYYFNDLSLAEIASENNVSRTAISDAMKHILEDLKYYEEKLELYNKSLQRVKLYEQLPNSDLKIKLIELEHKGMENEK